jgi:hypothetical protein
MYRMDEERGDSLYASQSERVGVWVEQQ